jgi:hypothetical protein
MNGLARSLVTCARVALAGRRYLVDWLPSSLDAEAASRWNAAIERCLAGHGMRALAVLVADAPGHPPDPKCIGRLARRFDGEPGGLLADWFTAALSGCGPSLPRRVGRLARRFHGDAGACVAESFGAALRDSDLPTGMGVFLPLPSAETPSAEGDTRLCRLGSVASLAVLARRCGSLYVPARPIEPSLMTLGRCLLVFPDADAGTTCVAAARAGEDA